MSRFTRDVEEFYCIVLQRTPPKQPRDLTPDEVAFRVAFLEEELGEYRDALEDGDRIGQLDALVDLVYVAIGTARLFHGFNFDEAWRRVHVANLAKAGGGLGKRGHPVDIGKPEGWQPADLFDLVHTEEGDDEC